MPSINDHEFKPVTFHFIFVKNREAIKSNKEKH